MFRSADTDGIHHKQRVVRQRNLRAILRAYRPNRFDSSRLEMVGGINRFNGLQKTAANDLDVHVSQSPDTDANWMSQIEFYCSANYESLVLQPVARTEN